MKLVALFLIASCATTSPAIVTPSQPQATKKNLLEFLLGEPTPTVCPVDAALKLSGPIDNETADTLVKEIEACRGRAIALEIDSPGGSVFAAVQIQKALERHDKPTFCVVDGMAISAAFVTLQSCTHRYATSRAVLMAHHASMGTNGQANELANGAEALRVVNWGMAEHCARRMGITHAEFEAHVADGKEWYFTQEDGLRERALDEPAESVAAVIKLAGES